MRIRRDCHRTEHTKPAIAAGSAKWDEDLVEKSIIAPAAALFGAGLEIDERGMVVPAAEFIIAETLAIAGQSVNLITDLPHRKEWPVHGKIHAMVFVLADSGVAVINRGHYVGSLGGFDLPQRRPGAGVGGHAGRIQQDSEWVPAKRVGHEPIVVGRVEKVIGGCETPKAKLDPVIEQLLLV